MTQREKNLQEFLRVAEAAGGLSLAHFPSIALAFEVNLLITQNSEESRKGGSGIGSLYGRGRKGTESD